MFEWSWEESTRPTSWWRQSTRFLQSAKTKKLNWIILRWKGNEYSKAHSLCLSHKQAWKVDLTQNSSCQPIWKASLQLWSKSRTHQKIKYKLFETCIGPIFRKVFGITLNPPLGPSLTWSWLPTPWTTDMRRKTRNWM